MRIAVTGAGGRLGRALLSATEAAGLADGSDLIAWDLPEHDLDDPSSAERLVAAAQPDLVINPAAWTDVDGCAREPDLAIRRNGIAVGEMAEACVRHGCSLITVSTNEVFDGRRTDGRPYSPTDQPNPGNAYGAAKLAGERAATAAFERAGESNGRRPELAIVRTAWLFGPPGADFPNKIVAAAQKAAAAGEPLRATFDEIGTPTYTVDLAAAIVSLISSERPGHLWRPGINHIVNAGRASRAEWAREVLRIAGLSVPIEEVPMSTWPRPSTPPAWGVLEPTPLPGGPLRDWRDASVTYLEPQASSH